MVSELDRLPSELLICIFERILDARCLFMCYSVCKKFATLVLQTRFVSVPIRSAIGSFRETPVWPPGILNFLRKLGCVESATIHFSLRDPNPSSLLRWKSDSSGFIFLFSEKFDDSTYDSDDELPAEFPLFEENNPLFATMEEQLSDSRLRVLYVEELIPVFPILKNISAVDSLGQGRVVLDEQGISRVKENHLRKFWVRRWSAPEVKVPFSGYVMKEVTLIAVRDTLDCDRFMEENWFEEGEYREVATTMMKKYRCLAEPMLSDPIRFTFADAAIRAFYHDKFDEFRGLVGYSFRLDRRYQVRWERCVESGQRARVYQV